MTQRIVVWLTENTWEATVDAAAPLAGAVSWAAGEVTLLHVISGQVGEATHGAFGGLLGRGSRGRDPGQTIDRIAQEASTLLLRDALDRLGHPARPQTRNGRIEREVVAACEGADLLVCARDGDRRRLGPRSLGHDTRFVVDHAPCTVLLIWPDAVPDLGSIPPPPDHHPPNRP